MPSGRKTSAVPRLIDIISNSSEGQTRYKACADCGLRIPQEQAFIFHEPSDVGALILVCTSCHWIRLGTHPLARPPHASFERPQSDLPQDSQDAYTPSPSSFSPEDRVVPVSSRFSQPTALKNNCQTTSETPATSRSLVNLISVSQQPTRVTAPNPVPKSIEHRSEPSPYTDITRLKVRRAGKYCLYPGSTFRGVQKSGRSDYDVTVTILDVDFAASFLCGYLEIRGLTEDWPELTTYFDAEIIGAQYSFLTRGWGATHEDDLHHWAQFPAYNNKEIQNDLQFPRYTLREETCYRQRKSLFMRWKERFLVPDHRVKDINGASFAGFYYICVEFEPPQRLDAVTESTVPKCRDPIPARMTGFYYHKHSEPNQQLNLHHVPDEDMSTVNGSFEWR